MSASILVLDLLRAHYRGDEQAFRALALRLAHRTKSDMTKKSMLEVVERAGRYVGGRRPFEQPGQANKPPPASGSGLLEPLPDLALDDLLLEPELRQCLDEVVLEIAHREPLAERKLAPRSRLLFSGPPGNGKTSAASAIAHELGIPAYGVSIPNLVSKYLGGTGENLAQVFGQLKDGCVIVLDEIDAIGGHRVNPDQSAAKEQNQIVNALLTLMDRNRSGTFVATTNRSDVLDPALRRRFDDEIHFPPPGDAQKVALARRLADHHGIAPVFVGDCANFDAVAKRTLAEARRVVMREILAKVAEGPADIDDDASADGDETEELH